MLCLVGCSASGLPATTDPDRLAVREFLRNDLSEPQWEEVEWWGGREGISVFTRVCRMKYRCLTPRGRIMMTMFLSWTITKGKICQTSGRLRGSGTSIYGCSS